MAFSRDRYVLLSVVAQALRFLFQCCVQVFLSPGIAIGGSQWEVQTLSAGIHTGARRWCSVPKKVFTSSVR
jgi:hypothetical protein